MSTVEERAYYAQKQREYRQRNADNPEYKARKKLIDKVYVEKHRAEISARRKAIYATNPEPVKKRARSYYHSNPDKVKAYRAKNREKRIEQCKKWRAENRSAVQEYGAKYYSENSKKIRDSSRRYYAANSETRRKKSQEWRAKNPEKFVLQGKRYRENNKEKVLAKNAKRRALLKGAKVEDVERETIYVRDRGLCGICGKKVERNEAPLDHIVPLSRGGSHTAGNLQIAHYSCNSRKGARLTAPSNIYGGRLIAYPEEV
jgi:5-methylcytosine-specific restriction endonuclease McrA